MLVAHDSASRFFCRPCVCVCVNVFTDLPVHYVCYWRIPAEGTQAFMHLSLVSKGTLVVWFLREGL